MINILKILFSEKSLTKVAGFYNSQFEAENAAKVILSNSSMDRYRVRILHPYEAASPTGSIMGMKIEPESDNIFKSIIKSHIILGATGGLVGLIVYAMLAWSDNPSIISTPLQSLIALIGFGITFGLLLAGFLSLRPDHTRLIAKVREALEEGKYAIIVHPIDDSETQRAIEAVERSTPLTVRTL